MHRALAERGDQQNCYNTADTKRIRRGVECPVFRKEVGSVLR